MGLDHREFGLGEVDAPPHPRRARPRRSGLGTDPFRGRGPARLRSGAAEPLPEPRRRLRVPVLPPAARADGPRERDAARDGRRRTARVGDEAGGDPRRGGRAPRDLRTRSPARSPAGGTLGRRAPARRDRARPRQPAAHPARRRTDGQPRRGDRCGNPRPPRRAACARADAPHGDARRGRRRARGAHGADRERGRRVGGRRVGGRRVGCPEASAEETGPAISRS